MLKLGGATEIQARLESLILYVRYEVVSWLDSQLKPPKSGLVMITFAGFILPPK